MIWTTKLSGILKQSGGPSWEVKLGRKDSLTASQKDADDIMPSPRANASFLVDLFAKFDRSNKSSRVVNINKYYHLLKHCSSSIFTKSAFVKSQFIAILFWMSNYILLLKSYYCSEYMTYVMEALELEDTIKNYDRRSSTGWFALKNLPILYHFLIIIYITGRWLFTLIVI